MKKTKTKAVLVVQKDRLAAALVKVEGDALRTTEAYQRNVKAFVAWCAAKKKPVTVDQVAPFLKTLKGRSASHYNGHLYALRKAFGQACESLQLGAGKAAVVTHALLKNKAVKTGAPEISLLTPDERQQLLAALPYRMRLIAEFLYMTGCRVSELTTCRKDQVKVNGRVEVLLHGKGNRQRKAKITLQLYKEIQKTFTSWPESEYLFSTQKGQPYYREYISREIGRATKRLFGRSLGAHVFRHSRATDLFQKTGRLKAVSTFLGHSDVSVTAKYYVDDRLKDEDLFDEKDLQPE